MPFNFEVIEKLSGKPSRDRDVTLLQPLSQALLQMMEVGGANSLTSSDVLYLTQMVEKDWTPLISAANTKADTADVMVSIASNYVKMASLMLEPHSVNQWTDSTEGVRDITSICDHHGKDKCNPGPFICSNRQVTPGSFTVIRSIDRLTETLADMLSAEKRGFTLSTKNISKKKTPLSIS